MGSTSAARRFQGTYSAEPAQIRCARRALVQSLGGHPSADDAALIASEFATNAVLHSASGNGGKFTVRAEIYPGYLRVEVEDAGGPWNPARHDDGRPHGLDVAEAVTGPGNWGIYGDATGRVAWATIGTDATGMDRNGDAGVNRDLAADPRRYIRVAAWLQRQINDGTLRPGEAAPVECHAARCLMCGNAI